MRSLMIILMFFVSCKSIISERHYNSSDEVTGGFNNFTLDLHADGTLILKIETRSEERRVRKKCIYRL